MMKRWEKALDYKWKAHSCHTFLFYLNVGDELCAKSMETTLPLDEYLVRLTPAGKSCFVLFFNRGTGIRFIDESQEKKFLEFLAVLHPDKDQSGGNAAIARFHKYRRAVSYMLSLFGEMLEISSKSNNQNLQQAFKEIGYDPDVSSEQPFCSVLIEYTETIIPPNAATTSHEEDRDALVTVLSWARSRQISRAHNLVLLSAESLTMVDSHLRDSTSHVYPIKLLFPDLETREKVATLLITDRALPPGSVDAAVFARISAGMSITAIQSLIKESIVKKSVLTHEIIFKTKKKFIEEQSGGLLEIMQPLWGIKAIGGLEAHKRFVLETTRSMKQGDLLAVPMGILLLGAPGTGKTVFAEAMAYEAGIPFVRMKNIRELWVGQSERNLDFALELIAAQAPVVVFTDEIDQEYQHRSAMSDNTGVNNRLQGRIFQFMSDTNLRGKVLWIAASNRPDLLDSALIREGRFDEKVPFFPPAWKEREQVLHAILYKMTLKATAEGKVFPFDIPSEFFEEFGWKTHWEQRGGKGLGRCDPEYHERGKEKSGEVSFTGAQIETIVQKAYVLASQEGSALKSKHLLCILEDYIPPHDILLYEQMTDLAILYCNSERFIPKRYQERARELRSRSEEKPVRFS